MSWIKTIPYQEATGKLKKLYDQVKGPNDNVDNVLMIHSLRPHTLVGHMTLYKNVLHNVNNDLPKWYLEALGVYVSYLNACQYCFDHHLAGFARIYPDSNKVDSFEVAVAQDNLDSFFSGREFQGCIYAKKLTLSHYDMIEDDVIELKSSGFTDGEVLEINQVVSYFNYVNRMVVGLGVNTNNDILGLSPNDSDDAENWQHT